MKRMALADSKCAQPHPTDEPVRLNRLQCVLRASRIEPAARRKHRRNKPSIETYDAQRRVCWPLLHAVDNRRSDLGRVTHLDSLLAAATNHRSSERKVSSRKRQRVFGAERNVTTMSTPSIWSETVRNHSLIVRLTKLRSTALGRTRFETTRPSRATGHEFRMDRTRNGPTR